MTGAASPEALAQETSSARRDRAAGRPGGEKIPELVDLLTLFSPAFPTGAFAYSHGLEAAIREGLVGDAGAVRDWIAFLLARGSGWNDLVLLAEAYRAADTGDEARLDTVAELALALSCGAERLAEMADIGGAFHDAAGDFLELRPARRDYPYPVAAGAVAVRSDLPFDSTLLAYAHAFSSQLLSAAARLVPLGQRDQMRVMSALRAELAETAARASRSCLDDLGSAAFLSDIMAMRHEILQPRLFRS